MTKQGNTRRAGEFEGNSATGAEKSVSALSFDWPNGSTLPQVLIQCQTANFAVGEQMRLFDCPQSQSIQSAKAAEYMNGAREWVAENPELWEDVCGKVHEVCRSIERPFDIAFGSAAFDWFQRTGKGVCLNNNYRAGLCRLYVERFPEDAPHVELRRSVVDCLGGVA